MDQTPDPLVIAVDSSTTATKVLVVDSVGQVVSSGRADLTTTSPQIGWHEQDARQWWTSFDQAMTQACTALSDGDRGRVRALCITAQRQTFALFDSGTQPVTPGLVWLDARATDQIERLGSDWVHERSGFQPDVTPSFYKLAWLTEHRPDVVRSAAQVAGVHGYLVRMLTDQWIDSAAAADSFALFDMARLDFDPELVGLAGLRLDQLPTLVAPGAPIAPISPELAQGWGLSAEVMVVAGCGDGQAAALGCGAVDPGVAYLNLGTAVVAGVHSGRYRVGPSYRTDAAGLANQYVLEIVQNSGAHLVDWFRRELGDPALDGAPDVHLEAMAAAVPVGSEGLRVVPYWDAAQSPWWDPSARGTITGFTTAHTRAHVYRAILEGISGEFARNLTRLQTDLGTPVTEVRVVGGGARSHLWLDIVAGFTRVGLTLCEEPEVSAMGAGVLAMAWASRDEVVEVSRRWARTTPGPHPNTRLEAAYQTVSDEQAAVYAALSA